MNGHIYLRKIVPIGLMFSLSLICGNLTYLYLSVSFIQMLKVRQLLRILLIPRNARTSRARISSRNTAG